MGARTLHKRTDHTRTSADWGENESQHNTTGSKACRRQSKLEMMPSGWPWRGIDSGMVQLGVTYMPTATATGEGIQTACSLEMSAIALGRALPTEAGAQCDQPFLSCVASSGFNLTTTNVGTNHKRTNLYREGRARSVQSSL